MVQKLDAIKIYEIAESGNTAALDRTGTNLMGQRVDSHFV